MSRTRSLVFVSIVVLTVQVAGSTDGVDVSLVAGVGFRAVAPLEAAPAVTASVNPARKPTVHSGLPECICRKLESAFPIAIEHLEQHETCRDLFHRFGADGIGLLERTLYAHLTAIEKRRYCRGGAVAVTAVGRSVTKPCPIFSRLSDERAAVTLIHEALHVGGQPESPFDRGAPNSFAISQMVIANCGF